MTLPPALFAPQPAPSDRRTHYPGGAITLALLGLVLSGPVLADATPPGPTPPGPAPTAGAPRVVPNPEAIMQEMARDLDKHADQGVFVLETITITQGEVADVIRSMPVTMAGLGYAEVYKRAIDTLVGQKAMVLNALKAGLDKDPSVIRRTAALRDRALADAWLTRQGDAAVTDQALHALYDRNVAGKPGQTEVRARLIVVPTEDEARTVIEKAQNGEDFAELAKKYSKDGSAAKGGDLGYASFDSLTPEVGAVAFALQLGQVTSYPVRTTTGYFVLRVEGRRQRATPTFDELKPRLEAAIRAQAVQAAIQNVLTHIKMAPVAKPNDAPK